MAYEKLPDRCPSLDAGDFVLRELRDSDAAAWYGYLSDFEVIRQTSIPVMTLADVREMIASFDARLETKEALRWAIARRDDDVLVGTCGFNEFNERDARSEIGYDLRRDCWGRGIMTAAVGAVVRYGFDALALHRIEATVMVGNQASARVLEKCGFAREGTLREHRNARGEWRDVWVYGLVSG